jgi:hypothetical protein
VTTVETRVPTVFGARWQAPGDRHWVEWRVEGEPWRRSEASDTPEVWVTGLPAQEAVSWVAVSEGPARTWRSPPQAREPSALPFTLPRFQPTFERGDSWMKDHYLLLSAYDGGQTSWAMVLDGQARAAWWWTAGSYPTKLVRARLTPDERLLAASYHWDRTEDLGHLWRVDWDGALLADRPAEELHHDALELASGDLLWLSFVEADLGLDRPVVTDALRAGGWSDGRTEIVYDTRVDYPFEPYLACDHVGVWVPGALEWTHANSLVDRPEGGFLLLYRWLDALVLLDEGYRFEGQIGGRDATFSTAEPLFRHGHLSVAEEGRAWIFDNGDHGPTPVVSRAVEIRWEAGEARLERSLPHPEGDRIPALGDVRPLPDGGWLVAWTTQGRLTEHAPDGSLRWEATAPGIAASRLTPLERVPRPSRPPER